MGNQRQARSEVLAWVGDARTVVVSEAKVSRMATNQGPRVHLLAKGRRNQYGERTATVSLLLTPDQARRLADLLTRGDASWRSEPASTT